MLNVFWDTNVYILCPANIATGGTESLHQLCSKLRISGILAFMVYYPPGKAPIRPEFRIYDPAVTETIEDRDHHILIIPEIYIDFMLDSFQSIRKVIWWLSVDNYLVQSRSRNAPALDFVRERPFYNLVQSHHTEGFLNSHKVVTHAYLSGFINSTFRKEEADLGKKSDNVLYNPKKGFEYTSRLIAAVPEWNWIGLTNMTPLQVRDTFATAKVYIDFGNHPGRDRFPREAALMKCCIITGKRGSAANEADMPIPNQFKFDEDSADIRDICKQIRLCLEDYRAQLDHFTRFHEMVKAEEERLIQGVKRIFTKISDHPF